MTLKRSNERSVSFMPGKYWTKKILEDRKKYINKKKKEEKAKKKKPAKKKGDIRGTLKDTLMRR